MEDGKGLVELGSATLEPVSGFTAEAPRKFEGVAEGSGFAAISGCGFPDPRRLNGNCGVGMDERGPTRDGGAEIQPCQSVPKASVWKRECGGAGFRIHGRGCKQREGKRIVRYFFLTEWKYRRQSAPLMAGEGR